MDVKIYEDVNRAYPLGIYATFIVEGRIVSFDVSHPKERQDDFTTNRWCAVIEDRFASRVVPGFVFVGDTKAGLYSVIVKWIAENIVVYRNTRNYPTTPYYEEVAQEYIQLEEFLPKTDPNGLVDELERAFAEVDGVLFSSKDEEDALFKELFIDYMQYRFVYEHPIINEPCFYVQNFLVNATRITERNIKEFLEDGESIDDFLCRIDRKNSVFRVDLLTKKFYIITNLERALV